MNEREAFEAWYKKEINEDAIFDRTKSGGFYFDREIGVCWKSWLASQAQQSQAARLLLLKLEIERICDDVKYSKDAKLAIQKLDFSKAASQAQQRVFTFDQLTTLLMQAATEEGHKVTMKIKWAQPPAPEGEKPSLPPHQTEQWKAVPFSTTPAPEGE